MALGPSSKLVLKNAGAYFLSRDENIKREEK